MQTETTLYINRVGIAEKCGISQVVMFKRNAAGLLLEPDVLIGERERPGWAADRVARYVEAFKAGTLSDPATRNADWWTVPGGPKRLLGAWEVAARLGLKPVTITMRQQRGRLTEHARPAAILTRDGETVGTRDVEGWTEDVVVTYGRQFGYLDRNGDVVPRGSERAA